MTQCPTSVDIIAATTKGKVVVDRFALDAQDPSRAVRTGGGDPIHGKHLMESGVKLRGPSADRFADLARQCGITLAGPPGTVMPSDGRFFLLALMAKFDGRLYAVASDV